MVPNVNMNYTTAVRAKLNNFASILEEVRLLTVKVYSRQWHTTFVHSSCLATFFGKNIYYGSQMSIELL